MRCANCGRNMVLTFTIVSYSSIQVLNGTITGKQVTHELDERVQPSYRCECGNNVYVEYKDIKNEIPIQNVLIPEKTLSLPAEYPNKMRYPVKEEIRKSGRKKGRHEKHNTL